ncbi:MAG: hypothetical protein IMW94_06615 [Thermoanaerobacter sp.]|nr:hypothetical protein [Thermoanaerobacter sp.]
MEILIPGVDFLVEDTGQEADEKPQGDQAPAANGYVEELWSFYRVHQTRPRCMEAGCCCWVSESDCDLFPLVRDGKLSGLCRERIPKGGGGQPGPARRR